MSDRERVVVAVVAVLAGLMVSLIVVTAWIEWPRCDLAHDGVFYGQRNGNVWQCQCTRSAAGWSCIHVDRN